MKGQKHLQSGLFGMFLAFAPGLRLGAEQTPAQFFEAKIRPVFAEKCYSCHSHKAKKLKAGLYMDSLGGLIKGGDSGPSSGTYKTTEGQDFTMKKVERAIFNKEKRTNFEVSKLHLINLKKKNLF